MICVFALGNWCRCLKKVQGRTAAVAVAKVVIIVVVVVVVDVVEATMVER